MDATKILSHVRAAVLVVDGDGVIEDVRGGHGGLLGRDVQDLAGTSVFDHVVAEDINGLATYFIDAAETSLATASLPAPFRVHMLGEEGMSHPVEVIPTGIDDGGDAWKWIVLVVPLALSASVVRPLEAEMAGATRDEVKSLLVEELAVDNEQYTSRGFLVELHGADRPTVWGSRPDDQPIVDVLKTLVAEEGWRPWGGVAAGETAPLSADEFAQPLRSIVVDRGWRRASVTPVHLDGELIAAFLLLGRVPADYDTNFVPAIAQDRCKRVVDAAALLFARWRDQDRLVAAATRDPLTGLANRDAIVDELAAGGRTAVLYIDVDHFKQVNDRHGHETGDRVLIEVAQRIVRACRPVDVVARYGGDEFVVLLHDVDHETALSIGERIVQFVDEPLSTTPHVERVTVSVGLADITVADEAVDQADRAMLRAKRHGRHRLVAAGDPSTSDEGP